MYLPTHLLTYLVTCLLTYLLTYLRAYLLTYLLTFLPTYLLTYLPTYLLTYLLTYVPTYLPTYLLTYLLSYLPTFLLTQSLTYLLTYLLTNNHSTETALLKVTNDIMMEINSQHAVLLVLLDLSAAFDIVDRSVFLAQTSNFIWNFWSTIRLAKVVLVSKKSCFHSRRPL